MTYENVKWHRKYGQEVADLFGTIQPIGEHIGWYHPSNANWSYEFLIVSYKNKLYEVMTQFGSVVGGREIRLFDNTGKEGL